MIKFDEYWGSAVLTAYLDENNGMNTGVVYSSGGQRRHYHTTYTRNGIKNPEGYFFISMNDDSGKLRLTRTDSEITSYYWTGSDWKVLMTRNVFDDPAKFSIKVGNDGKYGSAPKVEVHYDNFLARE